MGLYLAVFVGITILAILAIPGLRRPVITANLLKIIKAFKLMPKISKTEKEALEAGSVWMEADIFSGSPDFRKILRAPNPKLSQEEQAFIDGPLDVLCEKINDWKIYQDKEVPAEIWDHMKKIRIFGMIIPKKYGGLEFSALAHSAVIQKLQSRSVPVTVIAMVPNSLGPAELLIHYGTEEQREHYLPKLASGEFIPCFALTEQRAGSDAGSIESEGALFRRNGEVFIRLNWNKRWITLAGVSDVLGLAFRLRDPDRIMEKGENLGITCALIPTKSTGISVDRRHDPLGVPFFNCPTQGVDVEIPASYIIGGLDNAGKGWRMLMASLGAGRGISLPSQSVGVAKMVSRLVSAHTTIRKQFNVPLHKLEGLEEPLARIASLTYTVDALRILTMSALDAGLKPSVITAITKYQATEIARQVVNDGMDIMAGSGISRGPRNLIANLHAAGPIAITVEGANILTRTLIIFGQGLFRGHPYALAELTALEKNDLKGFDAALFGHLAHSTKNLVRSIVHSITRGHLASSPISGPLRRHIQKLKWASSSFAIMADIAMFSLGGSLKSREKLSGRYADILSWSYMNIGVIRRYIAEGQNPEDWPLVEYALRHGLSQIQKAFDGIFMNLEVPGMGWFFKLLAAWSGINRLTLEPSDDLGHRVVRAFVSQPVRERLTTGIFIPSGAEEALRRMDHAFKVIRESEPAERKVRAASRKGDLPKDRTYMLVDLAQERGIITPQEADGLREAARARWDAGHVDEFTEAEYHGVGNGSNKIFKSDYKGPAGAPEFKEKVPSTVA